MSERKKNNSKINRKPIFLIIGLIVVVIITFTIYMIFLNFKEIMRIEYDGYAISGKEITENLLGNSSEENKNLSLIPVREQDKLYKKLNSYFVGENRKDEINLEYPIYINDNSTIYNLSQNMMLITNGFEEIAGYPNLTAAGGGIYNQSDLERVDSTEYIFLKNEDNVYTNLKEIKIATVANEYRIPLNSSIYFDKEAIRYYEVKDNKLIYKEIGDIDSNSKVQTGDREISYQELLTKLKILREEKQNEDIEEEIIKEDTSKENQTKNEEVKKQENEETNKKEEKEDIAEVKYIKPIVTCSPFITNVYTMSTNLTIQDPSKVIQGAITFEIKKNGKVYLRKTYTSSGDIQITGVEPNTNYEIEGTYIYLNEQGQKVENTFYRGVVTTKGLQELKPITLSFENGEIFASKIQIAKLKISSNITDEAVKGVKRAEIVIENASYEIKIEKLKQLIAGQEITYETNEGLKSNCKISYEIKFYDKQGNEMKLQHNSGESKTAKQKPSVSIRIAKQNVIDVTLGIKLNNKDRVEIQNYRYVITKPNGDVAKESGLRENDNEIYLDALDPNQYYSIKIYGNYDVNDNKGMKENQVIGETVFATQPLSTLGYVNLSIEQEDLTTNTSKISWKIEEEKTDSRLIQILKELKVQIVSRGKNNQEGMKEDTTISEVIVEGEDLQKLKQGDTREERYEDLESNTRYEIKITAKVSLGETIEEVQTTYNLREFITLKKPAEVQMRNLFVTGDMIDFDVRIEDIDDASLTGEIRMELRDEKQNLIKLEYLDTNEGYARKTFEKLELNKTYTLSFYANQYNEGSTDSTYKPNYLLKQLGLYTEIGITGSIGLTDLSKRATGKNLIDMSSEIKWYSNCFNNSSYYRKDYDEKEKILTLGGGNVSRQYVYDLREYAGQEVTMSFEAKLVGNIGNGAYIQNGKEIGARPQLENISAEKWKEYSYTVTIDDTGYLGFFHYGGDGIQIKNLQIELGNKKTQYEEYQYTLQANCNINLEDKKNEIYTNDYYVRIYGNENLLKEERYEEIGENNVVENIIKSYMVKEDSQYKVELLVKINDREYILDTQEFSSTLGEIKGIIDEEEYLTIQPEGNYMILNDLDLRAPTRKYTFGALTWGFGGSIDYNGKTVKFLLDDNEMFWTVEKKGVIKNLVLDIYLPEKGSTAYIDGALFSKNYGTIENLKANLVECYDTSNKWIYIVGWDNYGLIDRFAINLQVPLYSINLSGVIKFSQGIIQNGYIYGENIKNTKEISDTVTNYTGFLNQNGASGVLKNVYSLISVEDIAQAGVNYQEANLVHTNQGIIENIYSVGIGNETNLKNGPNIHYNAGGKITNSYYFYDRIFNNTYDMKVSNLALYDNNFQDQILNSDNAFLVEELIQNNYYPQLNWPKCMPNQEYLNLPEIKDKDLPDITSIEVIEKGNDFAKVKLGVNNLYGETVTQIRVQNVTCEILSQNYSEGKTEVIAYITDPIQYVSEYSIMDITTKGAYSISYTRKYETNERKIYIDFYREINTINDWREINRYPNENYILNTDLNFINESSNILITSTYRGKLNGNNYTLSNITIPENASGLIANLSGTVENLNIENYTHVLQRNGTIGIITFATNAMINNVHVRNVEIIQSKNIVDTVIGGLVGSGTTSIIQNSSVSNLKIQMGKELDTVNVGGIIGRSNSIIRNCFGQDIRLEIKRALVSEGIGGIVGKSDGSVENCYTVGNIVSNREYVGGIAGYSTKGISNCYSLMDIQVSALFAGGIVGYSLHYGGDIQSDNPISYNLFLGNLYSSIDEIENRISGNNVMGKGNAGWKEQKINGLSKNKESGIILLDKNQIFENKVYKNILLWDDNYDYYQLEQNILPKLYNVDKTEMLKNQKDNTIEEETIKIEEIEVNKIDVNTANIRIQILNPNEYLILDVIIDGMSIEIQQNVNQNGNTYLTITGSAEKYFDSYKIVGIKYKKDGEEIIQKTESKIELQFFKEINKFEDWQMIDKEEAQNYRLTADIDFEGKENVNYNVSIGRLDGGGHKLKNININMSETGGLIKELKKSTENIIFENITIENPTSGNYVGVIVNNSGTMENVKFYGIRINTPRRSYVACISNNSTNKITNIELKDSEFQGVNFVGGLIGYTAEKEITQIVADNINIQAIGNYVGGIIGYSYHEDSGTPRIKDIMIQNSNIKGNNYVGGTFGYCRVTHIQSVNNTVEGYSNVGGITGFAYYSGGTNNIARNVTVRGSGNNIGGLIGTGYSTPYSYVYDSTIEGISTVSDNVGGIIGSGRSYSCFCC